MYYLLPSCIVCIGKVGEKLDSFPWLTNFKNSELVILTSNSDQLGLPLLP